MERDISSRFLPNRPHDIVSMDMALRSLNHLHLNNDKHLSVSHLQPDKPSSLSPDDSFAQNVSESLVPLAQHRLGQMHQPISLNLLLLGHDHLGTTAFLDALATLFTPLPPQENTYSFQVSSFFKLTLTLFPHYLPDSTPEQWLDQVFSLLDTRMTLYLSQKQKRYETLDDPRVHLCLYFFQGPFIKEQDVVLMGALAKKVNLIPLLALGDNHTAPETQLIKERMRQQTNTLGLYDIWAGQEVQAMSVELKQRLKGGPFGESPPFQVVAEVPRPHGQSHLRNPSHSDFSFFISLLVNHLVLDLRETTHNTFYRQWRDSLKKKEGEYQKNKDYSSRMLLLSSLAMFGGLGSALLLRHHSRR